MTRLELTPELRKRLEKQGVDFTPPGEKKSKTTKVPRAEQSPSEALLDLQLRMYGVEPHVNEHRFSEKGKWRFDKAWPALKFAVEIEGLTGGQGGRHQRRDGFKKDLIKYEMAMLDGWTLYRCDTERIESGLACKAIQIMLGKLGSTNEIIG